MDETREQKLTQNPKEVASVVRKQTFAVSADLHRADGYHDECPLSVYGNFSRFPVVLINEERKAATANIPIRDIADIVARTDFIKNENMKRELEGILASKQEEAKSIAYTTKLTAGEFKGRTPAEIILADPANKDKLNQHYKWLKDNIGKYPRNKAIMDAIAEAAKLQSEGKLSLDDVVSSSFDIYNPGMRPLVRKTNAVGLPFVYEIKITCSLGDTYPVAVEILNYHAPVDKTEQGLYHVKKSQMDKNTLLKNRMVLTMGEWLNVLRGMQTSMTMFEMLNASTVFKQSAEIDKKNYDNRQQTQQ